MTRELPTIRAHRIAPVYAHPFKAYQYKGDQPYLPPAVPAPGARLCSFEGCTSQHHAKGFCHKHHQKFLRGVPLDQDLRRRPKSVGFDASACGTPKGYDRHRRHGNEICQPCRDAKNAADRRRYAGRMAAA